MKLIKLISHFSSWGSVILFTTMALLIFAFFKNFVKVQMPNPTDMFVSNLGHISININICIFLIMI